MATLLVLYKTPIDPADFDKHYAATHIALAKKVPGLRTYTISKGAVASPTGAPALQLVATLTFDSMADLQAGLAGPEGVAAGGDLANFATGGADFYVYEDGPA